jgi:hypothetical protein
MVEEMVEQENLSLWKRFIGWLADDKEFRRKYALTRTSETYQIIKHESETAVWITLLICVTVSVLFMLYFGLV